MEGSKKQNLIEHLERNMKLIQAEKVLYEFSGDTGAVELCSKLIHRHEDLLKYLKSLNLETCYDIHVLMSFFNKVVELDVAFEEINNYHEEKQKFVNQN